MSSDQGDQPPSQPRRRRDSRAKTTRVKTKKAKDKADDFVEEFTKQTGHGAGQKAAQIVYPNQSPTSARTTASRLLAQPYVQQQIAKRRQQVAANADIARHEIVGNLVACIFTSFDDITGDNGHIDWNAANERGIAHLIQEVEITERHNDKTGASRTTTKYRMPNKLQAMDLLSDLTGWKREPQKNPIDVARAIFATMRRNAAYADMPARQLAAYPAMLCEVSVEDILAGVQADLIGA